MSLGVQSPPTSVTGEPLPSARAISIILFPDVDINDKRWTLATMQWGQIITHDMSMAMGTTQSSEFGMTVCEFGVFSVADCLGRIKYDCLRFG